MESSNWQTQLSTVRERTEYTYKNSLFCDVKFIVVDSVNGGGKVTIPANKYMLAISSPVFEAMFYGELTEKQDTIDLPDCTKEGLQELLRFVHSDEVKLTGNNVMEVLYIAEKYMMPFLATKCRKYLQESLKPEELFSVLPLVQKMSDKELERHCWKIIDNKTQLAISSKPFLELSREMLCQVLIRDSLEIKEVEIFDAVDKWAENKIQEEGIATEGIGKSKRAILGEVIRLIRFPSMSHKEIAEVVLPREVLKKSEITEIFQILAKVDCKTSMFNKVRRKGQYEFTENRFVNVDPPLWNYNSNDVDAVCFTVSNSITLIGVQLFGSQGSTYKVELEILQNDQIVSRLSSSYSSELVNDKFYGFTAMLDEPVPLDPKIMYTVAAVITGPPSHAGRDGQEIVEAGYDVKIIMRSSRISTNSTSVTDGQFPSFLCCA